MTGTIVVGATTVVELVHLYDQIEREFPVHANVSATATLYDATSLPIDGATNLPVMYDSGTGRKQLYRVTLPHTLALVIGTSYQLVVTATVTTNDGDAVRPFREVLMAIA